MTTKDYQLSLEEALAARDQGVDQVEGHADTEWKDLATKALRQCALEHRLFIVDQVWGFMPEWAWTHDNRAMGPIIQQAAREGVIAKTSEYRPSAQVQCHGNPRAVWRSLL